MDFQKFSKFDEGECGFLPYVQLNLVKKKQHPRKLPISENIHASILELASFLNVYPVTKIKRVRNECLFIIHNISNTIPLTHFI